MIDHYTERCAALRHYSSIIMDFRKIMIVQGFVLIAACFLLIKEEYFHYSFLLALFGLLFTLLITLQLHNDMANFKAFESQIPLPTNSQDIDTDPWIKYRQERKKRLKNNSVRWLLVVYGPSALIGIAFLSVVGISWCNFESDGSPEAVQSLESPMRGDNGNNAQ